MSKKTISLILVGVNIVLVIAIVGLIMKISTREPQTEEYINPDMPSTVISDMEDEIAQGMTTVISEKETVQELLVAIPHITTSVNVRSGPGTQYDRVGSAYADCEYEVVEVYDSGWTRLNYDGVDGYISSEYLSYKYKTVAADGSCSYADVGENELELKASPRIDLPSSEEDAEDGETQAEE